MKNKINIDSVVGVVNAIILGILAVMILYPLYFVVIASISDPTYVNAGETMLFPKGLTLMGYQKMFEFQDIVNGYINSIIYTVVGTIVNLIFCLPVAFALSRRELPGRAWISMFFVFTMYFSGGVIPQYLLVRDLHLINSMWALILPGALSTYNMIVCRSFFSSNVSQELFEATKIDGGSYTLFFFKIVLPLSKAIIAIMVLFHALIHWNSYLQALYYLKDSSKYPLQLVLRNLTAALNVDSMQNGTAQAASEAQKVQQSVRYAVVIAACVPVFIMYPFVQKYFVKGVMVGAIKG